MKKILLMACLLQQYWLYAQPSEALAKKVEARFVHVADGVLFMSALECSNALYLEYVNSLPAGLRELARPDSSGWRMESIGAQNNVHNTPIVQVYNGHPKYADYPVVNISQAAAKAYCGWLTETYNKMPDRKFKRVEFRLPNKVEWELAAVGKTKLKEQKRIYPWDGMDMRDADGKFRANYSVMGVDQVKRNPSGNLYIDSASKFGANMAADGYLYTAPCKSYSPNEFGLYNMSGNVSEFLDELGMAVGGSFISPAYYLQVMPSRNEFEHAEMGAAYIGFRPVMVVMQK